MIGWRLYLAAGVGLLFLAAIARYCYVVKELKQERQANQTLTATLEAERENTRKANEASERYAISLENLKAARAATPTRTVRLCVNPGVPEARTATGVDAPIGKGLPQEAGPDHSVGPDIGVALYDLSDEADRCAAQLTSLQEWIRSR